MGIVPARGMIFFVWSRSRASISARLAVRVDASIGKSMALFNAPNQGWTGAARSRFRAILGP
jgi:hypothetical protein